MSYTPTTWTNRTVEKPNTFDVTENEDKTITLTPHPGIVSDAGTAINAEAMNNIEQGIKDNNTEIENAKQGKATLLANLQGKDSQLAENTQQRYLSKTINKMINNQSVSIGCIGDSITWGALAGGGGGPQESIQYPSALQSLLRNIYNNQNITVDNQGKSGYQTTTWLSGNPSLYENTLNNNYDLVIIMLGINDVIGRLGVFVDMDTYKNNLDLMVKKATAKDSEVILMSPTITLAKTEQTTISNSNSIIKHYAKAVKYVAEKDNVFFIDIQKEFNDLFYVKKIFNPLDIINPIDFTHLTSIGYNVLAELVIKNLCPHLLVINEDNQDIPAVGNPYLDTNLTKENVNTATASGSVYKSTYYKDNSSEGYIRLKCFIDFDLINMQIVHSRSSIGGLLTIFDGSTNIGTIDFSTTDSAFPTNYALFSSSSVFSLAYGYHEIIFDTANLVQGASVQTPFSMYLEGFRFFKSMEEHQPNEKVNFVHNIHEQIHPFNDILLANSGKKLIVEFEGIFDINTGVEIFSHILNDGNKFHSFGFLIDSTSKIKSWNYVQEAQTATTTLGIATLDLTKRHKFIIEVTSDKVAKIYVDGNLEITNTLATSLLAGRIDAWCYDTTTDRSCEIYNLKAYLI